MSFRISALPRSAFAHLFDLSDTALAENGAMRVRADAKPGFPCRVSLEDAAVGEEVILMHYQHQHAPTPFRSGHAIYVRRKAEEAQPETGQVPTMLRLRTLSLRGFDKVGMLIAADLAEGDGIKARIETMLADPRVAYLHAHFAKPGCYAARIDRA